MVGQCQHWGVASWKASRTTSAIKRRVLKIGTDRGEGRWLFSLLSELIRVSRVRLRTRKRRRVIERILPRYLRPDKVRRRRFDSSFTWSTNNEQRVARGEFIVEQRSFFPLSLPSLSFLVINVSMLTRRITPFVRNNTTIRFLVKIKRLERENGLKIIVERFSRINYAVVIGNFIFSVIFDLKYRIIIVEGSWMNWNSFLPRIISSQNIIFTRIYEVR